MNPVDDGKSYIVQTGLKNGDRVVLENVQNLKDGSAIKPITPAQKEEIYQQNLKDQTEGNILSALQETTLILHRQKESGHKTEKT